MLLHRDVTCGVHLAELGLVLELGPLVPDEILHDGDDVIVAGDAAADGVSSREVHAVVQWKYDQLNRIYSKSITS